MQDESSVASGVDHSPMKKHPNLKSVHRRKHHASAAPHHSSISSSNSHNNHHSSNASANGSERFVSLKPSKKKNHISSNSSQKDRKRGPTTKSKSSSSNNNSNKGGAGSQPGRLNKDAFPSSSSVTDHENNDHAQATTTTKAAAYPPPKSSGRRRQLVRENSSGSLQSHQSNNSVASSQASVASSQASVSSYVSTNSYSSFTVSSQSSVASSISHHSNVSDASSASYFSQNSTHSALTNNSDASSLQSGKFVHSYKKPAMPAHSQYVAMDCEMVGTLTGKSACARVVMVDWKGRSVVDSYVKPTEVVTDYRTFVSGITEQDLINGESLIAVRVKVQRHLTGKILVGHALKNDLECLGITHPWYMIRDTAYYEPFMKMHYGTMSPRKLKDLAKDKLQKDIQAPGEPHSPAEDAITALELYKCHRPRWEACMHSKVKESQRLLRQQVRQQQQLQEQQMQHTGAFYGYGGGGGRSGPVNNYTARYD